MTAHLPAYVVRHGRMVLEGTPDWARRISGVSARLTKPDCFKCGGEDHMHSVTCARRQSYGNSAIAFGNAVIAAEASHSGKPSAWVRHQGRLVMAHLWRARREYEARTGKSVFGGAL